MAVQGFKEIDEFNMCDINEQIRHNTRSMQDAIRNLRNSRPESNDSSSTNKKRVAGYTYQEEAYVNKYSRGEGSDKK
jgi:hypothetical protein